MRGFRSSRVKGPAALAGLLFAAVLDLPPVARSPSFRSAAMIRSRISPMGNRFRERPKSNICGTNCAGALPATRTVIYSSRIRTATRRNTMAIARWARRMTTEAHKDTVDPEAWAIVDGKLYLTHNQYWLQVWRENAEEHIKQGDQIGRPSRIWRRRRLSGRLAPLLRRQPRSRCATAGIGSCRGKPRATHPGMS